MALFRKKSTESDGAENGDKKVTEFEPQPEKARKFFEFAKTAADSFNNDYALRCYASGIKLDPSTMSAHEAMFEVAVKHLNNNGKAAASKEIKDIDDGTPIGRFAAAEFAWMKDLKNPKLALRALEAAGKADQLEYGHWIAPRVMNLLRGQKKIGKSTVVVAMRLFGKVEAWDEALAIGQMAMQLDPTDADLASEVNNLSVQRAMEKGGYDKAAGKEGGYREMVKDIDKQRELEEQESISGNVSVEQRNLERAKAAYEETPNVPDLINQYAQLLKKQATLEGEEQAHQVYMRGFADTGQYRFRLAAGDIRIDQLRRRVKQLDDRLEEQPDDSSVKTERDGVQKELLELQSSEFNERVDQYPTDRRWRYELGQVDFALGRYEEAMGMFQAAKDEPKIRIRAGHMLGRCFKEVGWYMEAIAELEEVLSAIDVTEADRELDVRYDLMVSLIEHARAESSIDLAKQALDICSGIARKNITFRDIRDRRKEVDTLIKELAT